MINMREEQLHKQIITYLRYQYPNILFRTDFAAGAKLTIGQAIKNKSLQSGKGWPDIFIAKPINDFAGLFIEVKASRDKLFTKSGNFIRSPHIEQQIKIISELNTIGYQAHFVTSFEEAKQIIDSYLKK